MATTFKRVSKATPDEVNASLRDAENKLTTTNAAVDAAVVRIEALEAGTDVDLTADVTGVLPVANGGTGATTLTGLLTGNGTGAITGSVVGTQLIAYTTADVTSTSTTVANVTGLSVDVEAGVTYAFVARLVGDGAVAGSRYKLNGTATATLVEGYGHILTGDIGTYPDTVTHIVALSYNVNTTTPGNHWVTLAGTIVVNAAGTFTIGMARIGASGTATVYRGASLILTRMA